MLSYGAYEAGTAVGSQVESLNHKSSMVRQMSSGVPLFGNLVGACAMTTKSLDNENLHFKNFIVVTFPTKNSVLDDFPLCSQGRTPLKTANFIFIVVSLSLVWGRTKGAEKASCGETVVRNAKMDSKFFPMSSKAFRCLKSKPQKKTDSPITPF